MNSHKPIQVVILFFSLMIILRIDSVPVVEGAPSSARVESFPGYSGDLRSQIYSGCVTVNEAHGRRLFYYFIESERNPAEDPLLLWLTGGPGCSSFSGLIYEIGPFSFDLTNDYGDLPKVHENPHSWTKVSNIIFLDSPVGTGYSYSNTTEDYITGDFKTVSDVYAFFMKWFEEYPEFLSNPTYVGGDSYSGIFVPLVAQEIFNGIKAGVKPTPNFKGYLVGNGLTDVPLDLNSRMPFAHGMGLISDELYQAIKDACNGNYFNSTDIACISNLVAAWKNLLGIKLVNILDPICFLVTKKRESTRSQENQPESANQFPAARRMYGRHWIARAPIPDVYPPIKLRYDLRDDPCGPVNGHQLSEIWANNPSVRKAIHAQTEEITGIWERCAVNRFTYSQEAQSVIKYHLNLTRNGYRALIYRFCSTLCICLNC